MKFHPTQLPDVRLIELEPRSDARGFFARTFCEQEFGAQGLNTRWPQANLTRTLQRGMVRGLHWQAAPKPEIKLVRCSAGAIWDVVVDVRPHSPTFGRWEAFKLTSEALWQLYIPEGFAHGFQCLADGSEVSYLMSESYVPELARGLRWNDPTLSIPWPIDDATVSDRDAGLPEWKSWTKSLRRDAAESGRAAE
ncbi:MAG: dTDP-4-dehydrorhamnose 3,5-epimerase [Verrucomicrobiales bacterium]|nr:dTDP-4-dehydrorhamnose 3,5-epimerase [Verrucomicrobiales bacterium]